MRSVFFSLLSLAAIVRVDACFAHGEHQHAPPVNFSWDIDPALIFFLLLALVYYRARKSAVVPRWRASAFYLGVAVLSFAYLPMDGPADRLFSAHMVQHLLITSVGVPLIVLGLPLLVISQTRLKQSIHKYVSFLPHVQNPVTCVLLYEGVFWFWHIPYFYNLALHNDGIHKLEHACMALAAFLFWPLVLDSWPRSKMSYPARIALIGVMMTLDTALSAALTYSENNWYAYGSLPLPEGWPYDRLNDQRLGGILMWVPGSFIWVSAIAMNFATWYGKVTALKENTSRSWISSPSLPDYEAGRPYR
jgi:cytochrome c oxidase assembly factor CtaG